MTGLQLICQFCGRATRVRPIDNLTLMVGLYLAHLVESHWDSLERARAERLATGFAINDAWERL